MYYFASSMKLQIQELNVSRNFPQIMKIGSLRINVLLSYRVHEITYGFSGPSEKNVSPH